MARFSRNSSSVVSLEGMWFPLLFSNSSFQDRGATPMFLLLLLHLRIIRPAGQGGGGRHNTEAQKRETGRKKVWGNYFKATRGAAGARRKRGKGRKKTFFARRKLGNWSLSLLRKRRRKEGEKLNRPGSAKGKNKNKRERDGQQSTVRHRATMPPAPPSPLSFFSCAKNPFATYLASDKKYRTKRRTSIRSCFFATK